MLISEFIFLCPIKSTTVVKKFPPENRCKHIPKLKTGTTFQDEATFPLMSREPTEPTQDLSITLGFTHNQRFKKKFRALCYKNNQLSIVFLSTWSTRTVFLESLKRLRGSVFAISHSISFNIYHDQWYHVTKCLATSLGTLWVLYLQGTNAIASVRYPWILSPIRNSHHNVANF